MRIGSLLSLGFALSLGGAANGAEADYAAAERDMEASAKAVVEQRFDEAADGFAAALRAYTALGHKPKAAQANLMLGNLSVIRGDARSARRYFAAGQRLLDESDPSSATAVFLKSGMGSVYFGEGDFKRANGSFAEAMGLGRSVLSAEEYVALAEQILAKYTLAGSPGEMLEVFRREVEALNAGGGGGLFPANRILICAAEAGLLGGNLDASVEDAARLDALAARYNDAPHKGISRVILAKALDAMAEKRAALRYAREALELFDSSGEVGLSDQAKEYKATAFLLSAMLLAGLHESEAAAKTSREGLQFVMGAGMEDWISRFLVVRMGALGELGRRDLAVKEIEDIRKRYRDEDGALGLSGMLPVLTSLAEHRGSETADPADIRKLIDAMEKNLDAAKSFSPSIHAQQLSILGLMYHAIGDGKKAKEYSDKAVSFFDNAAGRGRGLAIWTVYAMRAQTLMKSDKAGALRDDLRALESMDEVRSSIGDSGARASFMGKQAYIYDDIITLLSDLGREDEAFEYAEKAKAQGFLDILTQARAKRLAGVPDEIIRKERALEMEGGALQVELAKATAARDEGGLQKAQAAIDRLRGERTELRKLIERTSPRYARLRSPRIATLKDIQSLLDDETAFLQYYVARDSLFLWNVERRRSKFQRFPVKDIARLTKAYREKTTYRVVNRNGRKALALSAQEDRPLAERLIRSILGASLDNPKLKRLIIAPDGELYRLPFGAMGIVGENGVFRYLVERFRISYVQSGSVLLGLLEARKEPREMKPRAVFAMANPLLRFGSPKRRPGSSGALARSVKTLLRGGLITEDYASLGLDFRGLKPLPEAEAEAGMIGPALGVKASVFVGPQASERMLKEKSSAGELRDYSFLHFATHGLFVDRAPELSCLLLAPDKGGKEDGFLTLGEIFGLDLDSDLVTLSACETGLGKIEKGEGLTGLTRGFMYAGAPSVLVSLWKVESDSTRMLMEKFYEGVKAGLPKDQALQEAQLSLWEADISGLPGSRPFIWAPFVLYGDWR